MQKWSLEAVTHKKLLKHHNLQIVIAKVTCSNLVIHYLE